MIIIPLERMTVPPRRQRRTIQAQPLNELRASILKIGLLHPIVVRPLEGTDGPIYQLVCGQRRLEAIKSITEDTFKCDGQEVPHRHIPVIYLSELDDVSRTEAELQENILRVDLTDLERNQAVASLHRLRTAQNPDQTQQDTAKELAEVRGTSVPAAAAHISRAIIIDRYADDPAVRAARTSNEAYNIITRRWQAEFEAKHAAALGKVSVHTLITGDLRVEMPKLGIEKFDVIIADPPYGIQADEFGDAGAAHTYSDHPVAAYMLAQNILQKGMNVAKPSAHLYLFCDIDLFLSLREVAKSVGWDAHRTPLIWYKGIGFDPYPGIGFRRSYEMILYCWKGKKARRELTEDVIEVRGGVKEGHAAEKPVELYKRLLSRSCIPGDSVLDPCCGSGTIFAAATMLALKATGIEIDEANIAIAKARMT